MSLGDRNRLETALLGPVFGWGAAVTKILGGSDQQVAAANQAGAIAFDIAGAAEVLGPATTRAGKSLGGVGAKKETSIPRNNVATLDEINVFADKPKGNSVDTTGEFSYSSTFLAPPGYTVPVLEGVGSLNAIDVTKNVAEIGPTIQFGANKNQSFHTFRHVVNGGYDANAVQSAVIGDLSGIGMSLSQGQYTGTVVVDGVKFTYSAYKLPDGKINVGRITPPR